MASLDNSSDSLYQNLGCFDKMKAMKLISSSLTDGGVQALESKHILQSVIGLIIGCGVVANFINIIVFLNSAMRQTTINIILLAISVSDFIMLIIQIPQSLEATSGAFRMSYELGFRQYSIARYGLSYILMTCAIWFLVAMVMDKILSSKLKSANVNRQSVLTSNKAVYLLIGIIFVASTVIHATKFAEYKANSNLYSPTLVYKTALAKNKVYEVYTYLANIILSITIPMLGLVVAVVIVIYNLIKFGNCFNRSRVVPHNESQINRLLLCLSLCYILCHAVAVYFMFKTIVPMTTNPLSIQNMGVLRTVNELLVLSYIAFKFLIYFFFVQNFKNTLKETVLCSKSAEYRLPPDGNTIDPVGKTIHSDDDDEDTDGICETTSFENPAYGTKLTE